MQGRLRAPFQQRGWVSGANHITLLAILALASVTCANDHSASATEVTLLPGKPSGSGSLTLQDEGQSHSTASEEPVNFQRVSVEQGLSQSSVFCILQDSSGFMWFGTQDGLNRYDGYEFTVFRPMTQTLFSSSLIAETVPGPWESDPAEGRQLLQELRQLTRGALAEMRTLLLELRPAALVDTNLADLLRQLCEAATGRLGVPISLSVEGQCVLPADVPCGTVPNCSGGIE